MWQEREKWNLIKDMSSVVYLIMFLANASQLERNIKI